MKLLIDADFLLYKACAAAEIDIDWGDDIVMVWSNLKDAHKMVNNDLKKIAKKFLDPELILFFSSPNNFRKTVCQDYKGQRTRKKPAGYVKVLNMLAKEYKTIQMETLEADDAMGIYATKHEDCVIVSPDKDMRQIPGTLFDMKKVHTITQKEADSWFLTQTLAGDCTDGYSGVPGYGVKAAEKLFEDKGFTWQTVLWAYKSKGLSEEDALKNARLARILRKEDYDFRNKQPILWSPTTTNS